MVVVWCELEVPDQLSRADLQCKHAVREEVVAGASVTGENRRRIADSPVHKSERGVKASRIPGGTSAGTPSLVLPCLVSGLTRTRNGVELPLQPAGCCVVRRQQTADAKLPSGHADDNGAVRNERRASQGIARSGIHDPCLPDQPPRIRIERHEIAI